MKSEWVATRCSYCGETFYAHYAVPESICKPCEDKGKVKTCAGCGEPWPCSDSKRTDISGIIRASHYIAGKERVKA